MATTANGTTAAKVETLGRKTYNEGYNLKSHHGEERN